MATHTDNYTLGRGELWFRRTGETVYRFLGNAPTFNLNVQAEKLEHNSSRGGVSEMDLSITTKVNRTSTLVLEDVDHDNIALALLGSVATLAQTSITSTTQTVIIKKGGLIQIGESAANPTGVRNVTVTGITKSSTPLVSGTDFIVDSARGTVEILETGTTLVNGDSITITYTAAAVSRKQTIAGSTEVTGEIKYLADNPQGLNIDYYLPKVTMRPNGDIAMIAENALQTIPLQLSVLKPGGRAAVYADGQPYVVS